MNFARHLGTFSWAIAAKMLPLVLGLVLILVVIPSLTPAEFGRFSIIYSVFNLIAILHRSLILHPMLRYASDPRRYRETTGTGLQLGVLFYLVSGVAVWMLASLGERVQRLQPGDMLLVIPLLAAFFLREYGFFVQQINYRTRRIFLIEAAFFLGASCLFLWLRGRSALDDARDVLNVIIAAGVLSSVMAVLLGSVRLDRLFRWNRDAVGDLIRYGIRTLPTGLAGSFLQTLDILVLGAIWTPVEVGIYNGAKAVYRVASAFTQAVGLLVTPFAARLSAEKREGDLRELFEKMTGYLWFGLCGLAVVGIALAGLFYTFFLGGQYADSTSLLRWLLIAAPFEGLFNGVGGMLYGMGFAGLVSLVSLMALAVLAIVIIPAAYFLGGTGAALSIVLALMVGGIGMFTVAARNTGSGAREVLGRLAGNVKKVMKG